MSATSVKSTAGLSARSSAFVPRLRSKVVPAPARRSRGAVSPVALFTGLVQGTATVVSFDNVGDFARLKLKFPPNTLDGILIGASVACNGTCLTVVETDGDCACFDLIVETLRATNLGELEPGSEVNYERSAKVGDEIGGHNVSGHVSTKATIVTQTDTDNNREVVFEMDPRWSKYILPKGFVAVDGCSLTVGEVSPGRFNVWLIPETIRATVFATKNVGSTVNIEIESQTQTIVDTIERVLDERGLGSTDVATSSSESSTNAASKTYEPKTKATVSDGYKDPMDELCEEDPSADECKVFD